MGLFRWFWGICICNKNKWCCRGGDDSFTWQHGKRVMQVWRSDIRGNYAEKILGHCSHRPAHKFAFVRKVAGRVAQTRDRVVSPDRQKNCSPPERPLCANNGRSIFAPNTSIQKLTFFCFFCFSMKALDFLFFESYIINKKILFIEGGLPWLW